MPIHYEIDHARRVVLSSSTDTMTKDGLEAHMDGLARDPDFDPTYRHLLDLRAVVNVELTVEALRQLMRKQPWTRATQRAFVVDSDLVFGMSRMAEILNEDNPSEIQVFWEISEALDWLGLDRIDERSCRPAH